MAMFAMIVWADAQSDYSYTFDFLNPANASNIYPNSERNINFTFNVTTLGVVLNASDTLNCSILVSNFSVTNYSVRFGPMNITNSTWNDTLLIMPYGRTYWKVNCSTMFSAVNQTHGVSEERYFDIINTTTYESVSPANEVVLSGVDVNFTWIVNATNYNLLDVSGINCSVHNASSVSGEKSLLFKINATNATAVHRVFAMAPYFEFTNVYWNINCTNGSIETISQDYSFGLQTNYEYTWQVPADNLVVSDLLVNFSWRPTVIDINLWDGDSMNCSVQNTSNMSTGAPLHRLTTPINTTNNTIQHQIVTMANRNPVAWRVNCSNGSIDFLSEVYSLFQTYSLTTTIINPTEGQVLTSRNVNYSWKFEALNVNISTFENGSCTLWRNGTAIFSGINTTNGTEINRTLSTVNGVYSLVANCTNAVGEIFYNESSARLFSVAESVGTGMIYDLLAPDAVSILASTSVNFSWIVNLTGGFLNPGDQLECAVNNRSSSAGNYSVLFKANVTNATFYNRSVTMTADDLHWWNINCTTPCSCSINSTIPLNSINIICCEICRISR